MTEFDPRVAALNQGPWIELGILFVRVEEQGQATALEAAQPLMEAMERGELPFRVTPLSAANHTEMVHTPRGAEIAKKAGVFRRIDWIRGRLTDPDAPIEVYWPSVAPILRRWKIEQSASPQTDVSGISSAVWAKQEVKRLESHGARPRKQQFIETLCQKFPISEKKALAIWADVAPSSWKISGRPKSMTLID